MGTEEDRQLQEVIFLLMRRQDGGSPERKLSIERRLQSYPSALVKRAEEDMAGPPPEPESLADQEDFVLLWQEQLLSARSELKAVIDTQRTFHTGLSGLAGKVPGLVGELPMNLLPEILKNITDVEKALEEVATHEKRLAQLRTQIKEWGNKQKSGSPTEGGADLKEQAELLASLKDTVLPALATRMKDVDDRAVEMQTEIVDQITNVCRSVGSRLQMESEQGWGATYQKVKNYSEAVIGGVGWVVSTFSFNLISKEKVTTLNVAVQSLVNVVKEGHVQVNTLRDGSSLDDLLSSMGPLSVYRANLIKYKDWFGAGLDLGGLTGLLPFPWVAQLLADSLDQAKSMFEAVLDGQLDRVGKLDDELKEAYEELKAKGTPTAEEIEQLKKKALSYGKQDLGAMWNGVKDQAKKFQDNWIKTSGDLFGKMWEGAEKGLEDGGGVLSGGASGAQSGLYDKSFSTIRDFIIRMVSELIPAKRPEAVFSFEIADFIKSLDFDTMTDFTDEEKDELASLSA